MKSPRFASLLLLLLTSAFTMSLLAQTSRDEWLTYYEKSGYTETPRYDETIEYCKRLDKASAWVKYTSFGASPQGRKLPLVILSKSGAFDAAAVRRSGKAVVLIQSGIHSGEIDGKDASLMLMREIAITKKLQALLDNAVLLFVPIFSVDAHERFDKYNRINQNGPEEMGWRVNAQNLNLNRDYMKADSPEMRAMLRLFATWLPEFYVDCHVTDGIDFQYDITYGAETSKNLDSRLYEWQQQELLPHALRTVEQSGYKIFDYVFPREENDLRKGLSSGATSPRLSTGYAAIQNRPSVLVETHMLKPYRVRVEATYHFLRGMIECVNATSKQLLKAVREADQATIAAGAKGNAVLPVKYKVSEKSVARKFLAFESKLEPSEISGAMKRVYSKISNEITVPFFHDVQVIDSVRVPFAYLIPQEWKFVREILDVHGIAIERLKQPLTIEVESYRFADVTFRSRPYEGRHGATYTAELIKEQRLYPAGTLVVRTNQRAAKVVAHLLEPKSADSFVAWGFFNAIFEQKEYAESYVMEGIGARMLAEDAKLKAEFENKVTTDTTFAKDPDARLNWLYLRSPWGDPWLNKYPIGRVADAASESALRDVLGRK
ncbi:MAG: M14 family metallopeptidase [Ignavibacteriae bacterium]|nr:M14 family metallopeptidase [Ignavibacteriota bacterium]